MSKQQHTPGPWMFTWKSTGYTEGSVFSGEYQIAIVAGSNYGEWRDTDDQGEAEFIANARLIAAAPELLEACEALVEYVERMHQIGHIQRPVQCSEACAAITKARGEA